MDGTSHGCAPCASGSELWSDSETADAPYAAERMQALLDEWHPAASEPIAPTHPEQPARGDWPLHDYLEYGPLPGSVPTARARTRIVLREWGPTLASLVDDTLLVVSELIGNAVTATRALNGMRPVRLWLQSDWAQVLVMVGDESPHPPLRLSPSLDAEHGRGLMAVEGISRIWGWYPAMSDGLAKVVWAEIGDHAD